MRVVLQVIAGPHAGEKILLRAGQVAQVGRTEWADFSYPRDAQLSGVHFALDCSGGVCRLRDLGSSNGTLLNGKGVSEAVLSDHDEIEAGQSRFVVRLEGEVPSAAVVPPAPAVAEPSAVALEPAATVAPAASAPRWRQGAKPAAMPPVAQGSPSRPYAAALQDADPTVRRAALWAAAWTRQSWLLAYCEQMCGQPSPESFEAMLLLAILAAPQHLPRMMAVGRAAALGPRRFQLLGAYGHPAVVELLLAAIGSDDPRTAVAAGAAFSKITGAEIDSQNTAALPPENGEPSDEFAAEFADEAVLPSADLARAHWREVKAQMSQGTRYCRGWDLSRQPAEEILAQLDMEARFEARLRGRFAGAWRGNPLDLEVFPQPAGA